jgi:PII-like signaling protein
VLKALELGLAGVTVLRGPMGFGANSSLHAAKKYRVLQSGDDCKGPGEFSETVQQ